MKKILALVIALVLLAAIPAGAESASNIITIKKLEMTNTVGRKADSFRFPDMKINMAVGMSGMRPTLQITIIPGEGQQFDAVVQIVGTEVLGAVGSISSVFSYDLERIGSGKETAALITLVISSAVSLGNASITGLLSGFTEEGKNGARVAQTEIPTAGLLAAFDNALQKAEGLDAAEQIDFEVLREGLRGMDERVQLNFSYKPKSGAFYVELAQEGRSLKLSGVAAISAEPFAYADIDLSANRVDVMNLSDEDIQELNDELSLMAGQLINHAAATDLAQYLPEK